MTEFRTQTSMGGEQAFSVRQERPGVFLLNKGIEEGKESVLLTTNEHKPDVYEIGLEERALPVEAAMLANAAFQDMTIEDGLKNRRTNVFALVETTDFLKGHTHATLYEEALGMEAIAMTRQSDEAIMLGSDIQEVNGNAMWTLHDSNIFRVA